MKNKGFFVFYGHPAVLSWNESAPDRDCKPEEQYETMGLLTISNIFMTFAWYGHLKFKDVSLWKVRLISWMITFFEYCFQVQANRIGSGTFSGTPVRQIACRHVDG
ncbi:MAG: DMT family protein [Ignavibacteriales bacterium]|nr:DMT family protein [Ignavibacteriales bacterium]